MWAIQYAPAELARCISRSKVIAFAIGAAQMFGTELFKTMTRLRRIGRLRAPQVALLVAGRQGLRPRGYDDIEVKVA